MSDGHVFSGAVIPDPEPEDPPKATPNREPPEKPAASADQPKQNKSAKSAKDDKDDKDADSEQGVHPNRLAMVGGGVATVVSGGALWQVSPWLTLGAAGAGLAAHQIIRRRRASQSDQDSTGAQNKKTRRSPWLRRGNSETGSGAGDRSARGSGGLLNRLRHPFRGAGTGKSSAGAGSPAGKSGGRSGLSRFNPFKRTGGKAGTGKTASPSGGAGSPAGKSGGKSGLSRFNPFKRGGRSGTKSSGGATGRSSGGAGSPAGKSGGKSGLSRFNPFKRGGRSGTKSSGGATGRSSGSKTGDRSSGNKKAKAGKSDKSSAGRSRLNPLNWFNRNKNNDATSTKPKDKGKDKGGEKPENKADTTQGGKRRWWKRLLPRGGGAGTDQAEAKTDGDTDSENKGGKKKRKRGKRKKPLLNDRGVPMDDGMGFELHSPSASQNAESEPAAGSSGTPESGSDTPKPSGEPEVVDAEIVDDPPKPSTPNPDDILDAEIVDDPRPPAAAVPGPSFDDMGFPSYSPPAADSGGVNRENNGRNNTMHAPTISQDSSTANTQTDAWTTAANTATESAASYEDKARETRAAAGAIADRRDLQPAHDRLQREATNLEQNAEARSALAGAYHRLAGLVKSN
jgi:hypothetical protein